ncbi:MAG TPA: hypothetical protein VIS72_15705 [Anaerolineales bacterium]
MDKPVDLRSDKCVERALRIPIKRCVVRELLSRTIGFQLETVCQFLAQFVGDTPKFAEPARGIYIGLCGEQVY